MSVASPCIGECGIPPGKDYCQGCYRSRDEITQWRDLPDPARQTILDRLPARKAAACADSFENKHSA
ncbi:MAG TPA: DUF1289 domain-containing protein [Rhodocyclaceae bacterium]|jgi:predicted Fe-S protein YdhL (DUF1289 family)|nr:DUF1289 domain-containing protein [Rhodocyclaceae bacterium]